MINNLPSLRTFVHVVEAGSLSAAARKLDVSLAVVSKRLGRIERELGVRLLQRTTRKQALTEEGTLFHAEAVRVLAAIEQAEAVISRRVQTIDGTIRLSAPVEFGRQWIVPAIAAFQKKHPKVLVQLELSDTVVDLLDTGMDLAIRFGSLADSSLIARPLAPNFRVLCASPAYLKRLGTPKHPSELIHHQCILIGSHPRAVWSFEGEEHLSVQIAGTFLTNDGSAAHALALEGAGIARKSIWDVGDSIADDRLRRVLPAFAIPAAPLNVIYPTGRHLPPRVRALVEFLGKRLSKALRWERMRTSPGAVSE